MTLVAFYLEGEDNQWWQWMKNVYLEVKIAVTWEVFEKERIIRFRPTEIEDYDKALSQIQQHGTLREYQREFERLANHVSGWPQKALV